MAYLNGIDVEKEHERAFELIRRAAEANHLPAIRKMVSMHLDVGSGKRDFASAIAWQEKLRELCQCAYELDPASERHAQYTQSLWDLGELYERSSETDKAITCYQELVHLYNPDNDTNDFSMEVVRARCAMASLYSKRYDESSQTKAWQSYSDAVQYLSDHYCRKMSDNELHIIATVIEKFAQSILHGPQNTTTTLSSQFQTAAVMHLRTLLETYNGINFDLIAENSVCHNVGVQTAQQFFIESGIMDIPEANIDPEVGYIWTDPLNNAEELLFIALGIYEYLIKTDIVKYAGIYSNTFSSIASLWFMMGYTKKSIHLLNLSISYLEKIQSEFLQGNSYAIATQSVTLGRAYIQMRDIPRARSALEKAICICEPLCQKEVQYAVLLSDVYLILSQIVDSPSGFADHLKRAAEILCANEKTYLSAHSIRLSLIRIYSDMARFYLSPGSWDYDKYYTYFEEAHKLCTLCAKSDSYGTPLYLCKLYNMTIIAEDCRTTESMRRVAQALNVAINNCKVLTKADSEFLGPAWNITIENILKINYCSSFEMTGPIANLWKDAFAFFVNDAIEFFEKLADASPLQLLPHKFRDSFSDITYANSDFIERYNTFLHEFYLIYINLLHDTHDVDANINLRSRVCAVYDQMIACQEQGYAFLVFSKEKRELMELLGP